MTNEFEKIFSDHDADDGPADGSAMSGGVIVNEGPVTNVEEFEARFNGPRVGEAIAFEAEDGSETFGDPRQQEAAEADAIKREPLILAAQSMGPDLPPNASDAERAARAAKFKSACTGQKQETKT